MTTRIVTLAGLLVTAWTCFACGADSTLTLRNDRLELSIDLSLQEGHCRLTDLKTGEIYTAADLGVVRAWDSTEDRMRTLIISPDFDRYRCNVTIDKKSETQAIVHVTTGTGSGGAMGTLSFGIAFDIELTLRENSFEYAIPIASLIEHELGPDLPDRWRLMNVELFPHLGATPAGSPGYIVIPSWSGALYYFDREHPRANPQYTKPGYGDLGMQAGVDVRWNFRPDAPAEYGSMMYGIQAAWEDQLQQPIFGLIRDGAGIAGILLSGAYDTEIRARRHQGPDRTCSVNPVWHYRKYWHSKLDPVDRRVRIVALDGETADYSGIANVFRTYLIEEKGVKTLRERAKTNPEVAYFMDSIYLRVMMGMKEGNMYGTGKMHSYQSWDQLGEALPLFQEAGFENVNFICVGANFEGHDGAHPTVFPLEETHGGEIALRRLLKKIDAADYRLTFHLNYKDCYKCSPDWSPEFIQVNEYGTLRFHGAWIGGFSYQGIPQEMLSRFGTRDLPKLKTLGLRGMHYWDACLSVMEETFPANHGTPQNLIITRREYGEGAIRYFRYAADLFGTVGCETTIAPLLGIIANAGNTTYPNGGASIKYPSNGYCEAALIDHWVPLQHMIYHGLCCYGGGPEIAGRTGYEFNRTPTRDEVETIRERYERHLEWGGDLDYEFFIDHREVAPGVTRSTFSDGTRIWVNKTADDFTGDGVSVEARGYEISAK